MGRELEAARRILGVEDGASATEIQRAARRLVRQHHPDAGGTDFGLRCVLAARAALLGLSSPGS
ncbi:MAG: hypothetical protein AB7N76_07250 [Planctomycetota bacterium]